MQSVACRAAQLHEFLSISSSPPQVLQQPLLEQSRSISLRDDVCQAGAVELEVDEVDDDMLEKPQIDHVWTIKVALRVSTSLATTAHPCS